MDPLQFDKQFKNMGIDREQVMKAGGSTSSPEPSSSSPQQQQEGSDVGKLKRKLEYVTNTILPKFQDAFNEMEAKLEQYRQEATSYKRDINQLRVQVQELTRKTQSVRVVFGDETSAPLAGSAPMQSAPESQQGVAQPASSKTPTPDDVRIDKIFNFSGAKF